MSRLTLSVALAVAYLTLGALPARAAHSPHRQASHHRQATASDAECEIRDGVLLHGARHSHDIALTFDACPTRHVPGFSQAIVDELTQQAVPATFFISGRWAEAHRRELAQLEAVAFFEIGLHGYRHARLTGAPANTLRAEIEDGREALLRVGALPQALFRPPFGDRPPELAATAERAGVTPVLWDVAPGDPNPKETAADIERDVLRQVRGGSIIVLHVNGRGVATGAALPRLLEKLRARGFRFVTVSELMRGCGISTAQRPESEGTLE